MKKGSFVVIEGPDGTGKETQAKLLMSRFKERGLPVEFFDFPQYETSFFGKLVGRFLKGEFGGLKEVNPYLASLTYAGDRWQASSKINEMLSGGVNVVSNRYFLSNVAHQSAKLPVEERPKFIQFLQELEYIIYGIPKEDLNIVLHIPAEISAQLIELKKARAYLEGGKKDIHEADVAYQLEVAGIYQDIPNFFPNVVGIDCTKEGKLMTPEEIHGLVWNEVMESAFRSPEGNRGGRERL
ncbi:MAG: thymidylate kinase [Candidatus Woesebacteria bacterium]|nr:MAG: thymidylate kinase [Candidatus Woesebacteria bacterium]